MRKQSWREIKSKKYGIKQGNLYKRTKLSECTECIGQMQQPADKKSSICYSPPRNLKFSPNFRDPNPLIKTIHIYIQKPKLSSVFTWLCIFVCLICHDFIENCHAPNRCSFNNHYCLQLENKSICLFKPLKYAQLKIKTGIKNCKQKKTCREVLK